MRNQTISRTWLALTLTLALWPRASQAQEAAPGATQPAAEAPAEPAQLAQATPATEPPAAERATAAPAPADAPAVPEPTAEATEAEATDANSEAETYADPAVAPTAAPAKPSGDHDVDNSKTRFRPGKGLHVESADGDFALATRLRAQFLYTTEKTDQWQQSFQIRRARLQFGGHVFGKNNKFKAEFAVSPRDMGMRDRPDAEAEPKTSPLLDWYLDFTQLRDLSLRVGQYKIPHNRQRVVSSGNLRLVDRSIVNSEFTLDRDLGFDLRSKDLFGLGFLRYYAGIYVGEGRNRNTMDDFGMLYLARVEVLPMGDFKDYSEGDHARTPEPKLSIGLGYAHLENGKKDRGVLGTRPADGGVTDFDSLTADVVFRLMGFSFETEFMYRDGKRQPGNAVDPATMMPFPVSGPRNGYGIMGQAGYLLPDLDLEVVARVGANRQAGDESVLDEQTELGGGVNYYFAEHPLKLQLDYFHLTERAGDDPDADWESEDRIRLQLQAAF
ncbi:MAG: OprO/OprP family phosphate-selective porin [Myxococcales bacterium]|nr:OprO/OprP family phosphate-selective porin [Myxococcales bacterium]